MESSSFSEQRGKEAHDHCIMEKHKEQYKWVNGPIIVGAGPSGLATAACLQKKGIPSLILERSDCIASLWQQKSYDRLRLHLPRQFCELPLMPFPKDFPTYPDKYQFIDYLEAYTREFNLSPVFNESVESALYDGVLGLWRVRTVNSKTGVETEYVCRWLIVATGENAEPVEPEFPGKKSFQGTIIHASKYKTGEDFQEQNVLVVGCGNSAMEMCLDLSNHNAKASMVVRNTVHVLPREMLGQSTFGLAMWLLKWLPLWLVDILLLVVAWMMLGDTSRYGLRRPVMGPLELKNECGKTPVLDVGTLAKIRKGQIKVMPAIERLTSRGVMFVNGQEKEFDCVILATGYKSNVPSWLKECDFFGHDGFPKTPFPSGWKGKSGLYAVGFTRRGLLGASMDAMRIAEDVSRCWKQAGAENFVFCRKFQTE